MGKAVALRNLSLSPKLIIYIDTMFSTAPWGNASCLLISFALLPLMLIRDPMLTTHFPVLLFSLHLEWIPLSFLCLYPPPWFGLAGFFDPFEQGQQLFFTCAQQDCVICKLVSSASDCNSWCVQNKCCTCIALVISRSRVSPHARFWTNLSLR